MAEDLVCVDRVRKSITRKKEKEGIGSHIGFQETIEPSLERVEPVCAHTERKGTDEDPG